MAESYSFSINSSTAPPPAHAPSPESPNTPQNRPMQANVQAAGNGTVAVPLWAAADAETEAAAADTV